MGFREELTNIVLDCVNTRNRITLEEAKKVIENAEKESLRQGLSNVISVCGADGNMIAVHVMDGAPLVSFDVSMNKAYTAVAVRVETKALGPLSTPGADLYGLDKCCGGRIIVFGGGVPLMRDGQIIGGIGISGGTAEQDHMIARWTADHFIDF